MRNVLRQKNISWKCFQRVKTSLSWAKHPKQTTPCSGENKKIIDRKKMTSISSLVIVCLLCVLAVSQSLIGAWWAITLIRQIIFRNSHQAWLSKRDSTLIPYLTVAIKASKARRCVQAKNNKSTLMIWLELCLIKIGSLMRISRKALKSTFVKTKARPAMNIHWWKQNVDKDTSKFNCKSCRKTTENWRNSKHSRFRATVNAFFIAIDDRFLSTLT